MLRRLQIWWLAAGLFLFGYAVAQEGGEIGEVREDQEIAEETEAEEKEKDGEKAQADPTEPETPLPEDGDGDADEPDSEDGDDDTESDGADPSLFDTGLSAEELALLAEVENLVDEATGGEGTGNETTADDGEVDPDGAGDDAATTADKDDIRAWQFSGHIGADYIHYFSSRLDTRQPDFSSSLVLSPELSYRWHSAIGGGDLRHTFNFSPFYRLDQEDDERNHFDVRELNLLTVGDGWNLRVGAGKVFWGALETVHWVDIINQTDLIENLDGEDKLGQPMVNLNLHSGKLGSLGLFVLPYFRERTFPGEDGRPRTIPRILEDEPIYESSAEQWHTDFALRWDKSIRGADIGLSYFYGTTREPTYIPRVDTRNGEILLHPHYEIIHQVGLDVQYNIEDWLLKLESVYRAGQGDEDFVQVAGGFEYTFYRIFGTQADLGVISEMLYDSRGNNVLNPYENDLAVGFRLALNDLRDTNVLFATITDLEDGSTTLNLEASMRFKENWKLVVEGRAFAGIPDDDFPLNGFREDHSVMVGLEYHF